MEPELILGIIGTFTGIIGTITGLISLIWLINKNKSKLKLERAHFHHYGKADGISYSQDNVKVTIVLRNLGHRSTTIDSLWITFGSVNTPSSFKEITIPASSSKILDYTLIFEKGELKRLSENGKINVGLHIIHTFGDIRRKDKKVPLENEDYNL
ncbi:MAG: hypothetical protein KJ674_01405 [Nanoarchaeota archaeon]|nr:hypothetical protein [Nanoarchaeota archaeon]